MCGSFGTDQSLRPKLKEALGVDVDLSARERIRPSEPLAALRLADSGLEAFEGAWGIKPDWSTSLLINARLDSVATKPTFAQAYQRYRCAIPLSYWYDNQKDPLSGKICARFRFVPERSGFVMMAALYFPADAKKIVSITTEPTSVISPYKDRMPYLLSSRGQLKRWLSEGDAGVQQSEHYRVERL